MSVPRPGSQTARVGFLVFVALAILIATIMSLGGEQKFWERKVEYEAVLGQSGDIVTNVVEVTASLRVVLQAIERGEGLLGAMVRNRELGESTLVDLQHTMANVQDTTRSLEDILQRLNHGEGILGRLTRNTKEVDELFARVNHAAKSLDQLSDRLNRGRGTVGKLME